MSKTLIGVVSYGGLDFLKLAIRSIRETATVPVDICVIVAKPEDREMVIYAGENDLHWVWHKENKGFPASVNDLYETAFIGKSMSMVRGDYDNLIIMGNDVVVLPGAIDAMIHTADTTDYEMVCGSEFNARFLFDQYPEVRQHFYGPNLVFTDFTARPWEVHKDFREGVEPDCRKDIRNFTLFKRSSFDKVGYDDPNFWPNGYFADNDYGRRCDAAKVSACGLKEAAFFHFVSRTIHQNENRDHGGYFSRNGGHYVHKWGGPVGGERYALPYDGRGFELFPGFLLPGEMEISDRSQEEAIIKYWSTL